MSSIEIVCYRSSWPDEYRSIADVVMTSAPSGSSVHHIGSTAVPRLAAKDVIDLQLTVTSLDAVDVAAIARCGFHHVPGLRDHVQPGMALPSHELAKLYFRATGRLAHLHVRELGRFNQRYALVCRDYLRAHAGAARAYEVVKRELAARFPNDADAYYAIKDPVFDIIMAGANQWAEATGWREPPAD